MTDSTNKDLPIVAIVGRPNVGKSALFNAIIGRRISIVHEQSGVTRDRVAAPANHHDRHFLLVDTGGLGVLVKEKKVEMFDGLIRSQVEAVVDEADVIIWVVDGTTGALPMDHEVAEYLHHSGRTIVLAVNKSDNRALGEAGIAEFAALGFEEMVATSCTQNRGIGFLLDMVSPHLPKAEPPAPDDTGMKLAVVGRPNVGKSSLVNQLLGEERVIVSDIAGTTRDAIDVPVRVNLGEEEVPLTLIDTAGLRRKRQVDTVVEFFSMTRAEKAIKRSDCVLFVVDAHEPGTAQDRRIANMITTARKPCIIVANKWDLLDGRMRRKEFDALLRELLPFMAHAPIETVSALTGDHVTVILEHLITVREQMRIMIPTPVLNRFLEDITARTPPPAPGKRPLRIYYATMVGNPPPHFLLFVNETKNFPTNYLQFLENQIRRAFFPKAGLPMWLEVRRRRPESSKEDGTRRAAAGVKRLKEEKRQANARHASRRKGHRKR